MPGAQVVEPRVGLSRTISAWLQLARISNAPTVATNVFAGAALSGFNLTSPDVLLTALCVTLLYIAGMMLNDVCDIRIDRIERPERPLITGVLSPVTVMCVVVVLCVGGVVGLWRVSSGAALLPALILVGLIVLYDCWHKASPFSSLIMGGCRAMVYVVAFMVFESFNLSRVFLPCALMVVYIAAITLLARNESRNRPMLWPVALLYTPLLFPVLSAWAPMGVGSGVADWRITGVAMVMFAGWTSFALRPILSGPAARVGLSIARLLAGIALFDTIITASLCEWTFSGGSTGMAVVALSPPISCLLLFGLTVVLQRRIQAS